jgi:hypothetical protein
MSRTQGDPAKTSCVPYFLSTITPCACRCPRAHSAPEAAHATRTKNLPTAPAWTRKRRVATGSAPQLFAGLLERNGLTTSQRTLHSKIFLDIGQPGIVPSTVARRRSLIPAQHDREDPVAARAHNRSWHRQPDPAAQMPTSQTAEGPGPSSHYNPSRTRRLGREPHIITTPTRGPLPVATRDGLTASSWPAQSALPQRQERNLPRQGLECAAVESTSESGR